MRSRTARWSLSAAVLVVAGMTLSACGPDSSDAGSSASSSSASTGSQSTGGGQATTTGGSGSGGSSSGTGGSTGSGASAGGGSGTGGGSAAGAGCRTSNLSFSSSGGMAEGEVLVNLKNVGSTTCSLHGFPGVDLKGHDGTDSVTRSTMKAPTVTLAPGRTTDFTLHYPPNNTGGSGVTFTTAVVTPPNETHSHTMPLGINVPVTDGSGPGITVDPVGAGK
ncbi:DUF4232 domain-containing protein [Streptantibioticus parmotrematis]|uniref:DUF4232 domain-containing protein n=1 Tax=Streptantibioticus parmotrematis TaxID=2873249 RepID=UPI0033F91E9F